MGLRRGSLTQDIGSTGLDSYGGYVRGDFLSGWDSTRDRVKKIEEMLFNSPIVAALRLAIEMPVRDVDWFFTSELGNDDPRLELLNEAWNNMSHSFADHVSDTLLMVFYGWSAFSVTYEKMGGRWLWRKFKLLGHDTTMRWDIDDDGGIKAMIQYPHLWKEPIPIERMILYRFRKTKNNPEGESILRPAYIPYYYIKNIQTVEAIGIERNLAGMPVIEMPFGSDPTESSSTNSDYGRAHQIVRNLRRDEQDGIILPPPATPDEFARWKLTLLTTGGGAERAADADRAIIRYEKRILMSALAQFLILGMEKIGTQSAFEGGTDFFAMAVGAVADIVADTFTQYGMERLLALNGMDSDGIQLEHGRVGNVNLEQMGTFLQQAGAMITWTEQDEQWIRSLAKLPEKTLEELAEIRGIETERKAAMVQGLQQAQAARQNQPADDSEDDTDENGKYDVFAAGNSPDDIERLKFERTWQNKMSKYWREQRKRVTEGLR